MKSYFIISTMFRGLKYYYVQQTDVIKASWGMHTEDAMKFTSKDQIQKEISENFAKFEKHEFVTVETILTTK